MPSIYNIHLILRFLVLIWQSNREAGMFMTALSFPPSYPSLSAIFPFLSAPIQTDSHIDVSPRTGE